MAQLAPLAQPVDPIADDHLGFDAWLLPPQEPGRGERAIRAASTVAGPVVFIVALAGVVAWIA